MPLGVEARGAVELPLGASSPPASQPASSRLLPHSSTKVTADAAAPIKEHVTRSMEQLAGANIAVNAEPDSKSR